jgi:hypothetical protein
MTFQYYNSNIYDSIPIGKIHLDKFIQTIQRPRTETINTFNEIRQATIDKDETKRGELKKKLHYFTPCVFVNGKRKYDNIINFTGLLCLDFDKLDEQYCVKFKQYLFEEYQFIICSWLSTSKHGVRAFVKIPICTSVEEFKHYYAAIENHFSSYKGFDKATKNCILPLFLSYDPDMLYRDNYSEWSKKYIKPEQVQIKQYIIKDKSQLVTYKITKLIDVIVDNGHPQLRAAAFLLGGFVGAGHIDQNHSIDLINNLITSNKYLSQKASTYKKTAKEMIDKGFKNPVYL